MSNSFEASGSSFACAAFSYEREMPHVRGSRRMNFIAFGFGVGSISAIFGIVYLDADERRYTPIKPLAEVLLEKSAFICVNRRLSRHCPPWGHASDRLRP